jgi:hypothetical protein
MDKSENINELATALSKAQLDIKAAKKTSTNPYYKSKYADLLDTWEAARESICKNGLAICHTMGKEDGQLMLYTTLMHSSGQWMKSTFPIICKDEKDIQKMGAAITYLKRYCLGAILCICTDEDDDGDSNGYKDENKKSPQKQQQKITTHNFSMNANKVSPPENMPDIQPEISIPITPEEIEILTRMEPLLDDEYRKKYKEHWKKLGIASFKNMTQKQFKTFFVSFDNNIKKQDEVANENS